MLNKKIKIKIVAIFALMFQILFLNGSPVFAQFTPGGSFEDGSGEVNIPEPMSVVNEVLDKYSVSQDSLKDMNQGFNVSANKIYTPEVKLTFDPSEPKEGEKITASALPMYFTNPKEELYFTWYIVHEGENESVNDWKIEAMRLVATQGYDNQDEPKPDYNINGDNDEFKAYFGGGDKGAAGDSNKYCYIYDAQKGATLELPECRHVFPHTGGNGTVGDGTFGHQEEQFWGTNPQDPNTAGNGNLDEANVAGKGQDKFSWIYQTGDRVGVAVEGTSIIATKYDDASYMTMWAFPKNKFVVNATGTRLYCQPASNATNEYNPECASLYGYPAYDAEDGPVTTGYFDVHIPTANNTLEEAFEDNLVDPAEKTNEKLDVALSYTPENPINDTSTDNLGDLLYVDSSIANASQDPSQIHYEWKVSAGKSMSGNFTDISSRLDSGSLIKGKLSGINNPRIGVSLNLGSEYDRYFSNKIGYLKIRVTAKESIPGKIRIGKGEVIVRVNATGNKIRAYLTSSSDGNALNSDENSGSICNATATSEDRMATYICPVIKNQILKLKIDGTGMTDFAWSVNGGNIICDSSLSSECSGGNVIFLPILGSIGDELNVRVTAKNISTENNVEDRNNGKSVEFSKKFQIVKPYIKIFTNEDSTFWPKLLGNYIDLYGSYVDLEGNPYSDYSDSLFETYVGANASLTAEIHPTWLERSESVILNSIWTLDGEENTNTAIIEFPVTKNIGEAHKATFSSFYVASNEIRRILLNYWGVTQAQSSGELISSSVSGQVVPDNSAETLSLKSPTKFLASIISNLPSQTLFLLRTVLVIFMIILVSGLAMNFSPNFHKNKE